VWEKDKERGSEYFDEESRERSYLSGPLELTDTLIAWPDEYEQYKDSFSPGLNMKDDPIRIEGITLIKTEDGYRLEGGERTDIRYLPKENGYVHEWDNNEHLPIKTLPNEPTRTNPFDYHPYNYWVKPTGLRVMIRGGFYADPLKRRFDMTLGFTPSDVRPDVGFRLGLTTSQ
jgi:hypothetical protein